MKTGLVIAGDPRDFVRRFDGVIALHESGIPCQSFGERGQSQSASKEPGAMLASVEAGRLAKAARPARLFGAEIAVDTPEQD